MYALPEMSAADIFTSQLRMYKLPEISDRLNIGPLIERECLIFHIFNAVTFRSRAKVDLSWPFRCLLQFSY